jgi:hypothetical protein
LDESLIKTYNNFANMSHNSMKNIYKTSIKNNKIPNQDDEKIMINKSPKINNRFIDVEVQTTNNFENSMLIKNISEYLKTDFKDLPYDNDNSIKDYWKSIVKNVSDLRNFQSQSYVLTLSMKNSFLKLLDVLKNFDIMANNEEIRYHKYYLESILGSMLLIIDKYEKNTFLQQNLNFLKNQNSSPIKNFKIPYVDQNLENEKEENIYNKTPEKKIEEEFFPLKSFKSKNTISPIINSPFNNISPQSNINISKLFNTNNNIIPIFSLNSK